jgi:hypothetical protein
LETVFTAEKNNHNVKKIEVCAPFDCLELLQVELAAAGISVEGGLAVPCRSFRTDTPIVEKPQKWLATTQCKIELIVSDRLADRTIEIVTDLLCARNWKASLSQFDVLDAKSDFRFDLALEEPLAPKLQQSAPEEG